MARQTPYTTSLGGGDDAQALGGVEIHARELVGLERGDRDVGDGREVVEDVEGLVERGVLAWGLHELFEVG